MGDTPDFPRSPQNAPKPHLVPRPAFAAAVHAVETRVQPPPLPEGTRLVRGAAGGQTELRDPKNPRGGRRK